MDETILLSHSKHKRRTHRHRYLKCNIHSIKETRGYNTRGMRRKKKNESENARNDIR